MPTSMFWCYRCDCEVAVTASRDEEKLCPQCNMGFVEELGHEGVGEDLGGSSTSNGGFPPHFHPPPHMMMRWGARRWMRDRRYRHGPPPPPPPQMPAHPMELQMEMMETMSAFMSGIDGHGSGRIVRVRHGHPSDPMVLVRGLPHGLVHEEGSVDVIYDDHHHHHHHNDHRRSGFGIGRRHHHGHAHMDDYGLDQLIQHLATSGVSFSGSQSDMTRCGPLPAARSAVDAMPTVKISQKQLSIDSHCAVCTDQFEIGGEAREMPCKHIYHADCILPWLAQHNSCPVCRHELPAEEETSGRGQSENGIRPSSEENNGGLTIWGLPGGGFAVGRFSSPRVGSGSSTTSESSSSRNSSVIFRRGFVPDLGMRAENQAQGRRSNPLSFLWPFRSSNSNSESSSSNNGNSRWWSR